MSAKNQDLTCDKKDDELQGGLFENSTIKADNSSLNSSERANRIYENRVPDTSSPMKTAVSETDHSDKPDRQDRIKQSVISVSIERIVLISVCIAIGGGFTVPIIIYAVGVDQKESNSMISIDFDIDNCSSSDMDILVS